MQICDYSSLIFAGNTTVLLILSLTTDYWEYRRFDRNKVLAAIGQVNGTQLIFPIDTNSYIQIRITHNVSRIYQNALNRELLLYHPPLFVRRMYVEERNRTNRTDDNKIARSELNLFEQYGNLFRDCDALEKSVRKRLGLQRTRESKCEFLHSSEKSSTVYDHKPYIYYLEICAGVCALLCMLTIAGSLFCGGYGLFSQYMTVRVFYTASRLSLVAGFFLLFCIALFHGKCYVMRQMDILPGHDLPFRELLNASRIYSYGWSFTLAWICVIFCYTAAYVWLCKAQGSNKLRVLARKDITPRRKRVGNKVYTRHKEEDSTAV